MKLIIDNILDKCIVHTPYICIYLTLIQNLYLNVANLNQSIENSIESIYNKIQNQDINKEQSEYLQFCDKNKKLDQLIGHSLLITECEKLKIISNKIHPSLKELLSILETNEDSNEKYKRAERTRDAFYRCFSLPDTADCEHIEAKGANGVLEITIPKHEKVQPRRIEVKS